MSSPVQVGTSSWSQVSSGQKQTLGILITGALYAWGNNASGQLGLGDTINRASPVQVGLSSWSQVSTEASASLGILITGALFAWGVNNYGQLGLGNTTNRSSPVQVGTSSWSQITVGPGQVLGILTNNALYAWGWNNIGQLGLGDRTNRSSPTLVAAASGGFSTHPNRSKPTQIGTSSWSQVSAGTNFSLGLLVTTGALYAWGQNSLGQLGQGDTINRSSPVQIGSSSWSQIDAGNYFSLGILTTGALYAWGYNFYGNLGQGNRISTSVPVQIGSSSWSQISAGGQFGAGLLTNNTLYLWGAGWSGQLGLNDTVNRSSPTQIGVSDELINRSAPIQVGSSSWSQVAAGENHSLGLLTTTGALFAWGNNYNGELGTGDTVNRSSPVQIGSESWSQVSAGTNSLGILTDGTAYVWGQNSSGQIGNNTRIAQSSPVIVVTSGDTINRSSPVQVGTSSWSQISAGRNYSVGLLAPTGTLFTWGHNSSGQLGLSNTTNRSSPVQVGTDSWSQISAGDGHNLGLLVSTGALYAWGNNASGQLGKGDTLFRSSPVQVGTSSWSQINAGGNAFSLGLLTTGALYAWGYNFYGYLGLDDTVNRSSPVQVGTSSWSQINAGYYNSSGTLTNNFLYMWGYNALGQLGLSDTTDRSSPTYVSAGETLVGDTIDRSSPTQVAAGVGTWSQVTAGNEFTLGISSPTGALFAWGSNPYGQLGLGDTIYRSTPAQVGTDSWSQVSAGDYFTLGISTIGSALFTWGFNSTGQLAVGDTINRSSPVQVGTSSWSQVNAGSYFGLGTLTNGVLYAWGNNFYGNLGVGDTITRSSPTQVGTSTWTQIEAGASFSLGITSINNSLFAWGYNANGQLGLGNTTNRSTPVLLAADPVQVWRNTNNNLAMSSPDGYNWTVSTPTTSKVLYGVTSNNTDNIIAVGQDGIICRSYDGINWQGVNEAIVASVDSITDVLNVTNTAGFAVNDEVQFTESFNVLLAGVTYYIINIISSTQIQVSTVISGSSVDLNDDGPIDPTYMYLSPRGNTLKDVYYSSSAGLYVAVGEQGTIIRSTTGYTWTLCTPAATAENLNGITYNEDNQVWMAVGDNNTVVVSEDNAVTWTLSDLFKVPPSIYTVQGAEFEYGYGPEELVAGVTSDNLTMLVNTRPGTNWPAVEYAHVGYNVVSVEYTPEYETQTEYSFKNIVDIPSQVAVYVIDATTGLGTAIYSPDYTVDWINFNVVLANPLNYTPASDRLKIDVYEAGNGDQLVKSSTNVNPIQYNDTTGWNEIDVDCNYSSPIFNGNGIIVPGTQPRDTVATETTSGSDTIQVDSAKYFIVNDPITFQGTTFGGIQEEVTYYVKTISIVTNRITVSASLVGGLAGPTFALTNGTGSMYVVVQIGSNTTWTEPLIYHNGNKLMHGTTGTVTKTTGGTRNTVTCNTTNAINVNDPIVFSDPMFGGILLPQTTYYVKSIYDANEFTVSATPGGSTITLSDATGGAQFITNDYCFGIADNGISAKIIFATGNYDVTTDYISYTLLGETEPAQYGYTIPETELFTGDGSNVVFTLSNYSGGENPDNAVVEINGLRITGADYLINGGNNTITFNTAPLNGDTIAVTTFNSTVRQYFDTDFNITGNTVANIVAIDNKLTPYLAVTDATSVTSNYITCGSTSGFVVDQPIIFKGSGVSFSGIAIDGTVYFINDIVGNTFQIKDQYGSIVTLTNGTGSLMAYVGGITAIRITTGIDHSLSENDLVRIDGVSGSVQLNNQTYYAKIITDTVFDLYSQPYNPDIDAINYPVTYASVYTGGGYVWKDGIYTLVTTDVVQTINNPTLNTNRLETSGTTDKLIIGTPIIFTSSTGAIGGIELNTVYYVREIFTSTLFSIEATRNGTEFVVTNDTGTMNATQWSQIYPDRLWITVNGYRVPSSSIKINEYNNVSILTTINPGDEVIITSMMPSATPDQETYLLGVNKFDEASVYRINSATTTWLAQPLVETDSYLYVNDVSKITTTLYQTTIAPATQPGYLNIYTQDVMVIGMIGDKKIITGIVLYNNTRNFLIDSSNYTVTIQDLAPIIVLLDGTGTFTGDELSITILEGNVMYVNGEQIGFTDVDPATNIVSGLQRGINGTGVQDYIPEYTTVYGMISTNKLPATGYNKTWNSYVYNTEKGDPLQISETVYAEFLNSSVP